MYKLRTEAGADCHRPITTFGVGSIMRRNYWPHLLVSPINWGYPPSASRHTHVPTICPHKSDFSLGSFDVDIALAHGCLLSGRTRQIINRTRRSD